MSADPEAPTHKNTESGGYVVKNMIYQHTQNGAVEVMTGWNDGSVREFNQEIVPPADPDMHRLHPCIELNKTLLACSAACEPRARLAARVSQCNDQRRVMMQCMVKNKKWRPPAKADDPWYKVW